MKKYMKIRIVALGMCMVMCLSACSMNKNTQETSSNTKSEILGTEASQNAELVLLDQEANVEICEGAMIAQIQEPFSGVFWEDEKHEKVKDAYYVKFTNCTDFMIRTADITLGDDEGELLFHIDMLKAGESVFVVEADKQEAKSESIRYIDSNIEYADYEHIITEQVKVDSVSKRKLKITNLTGDFLPLLRIFYGPVNKSGIRISGAAFSVPVDGLEASQEMEIVTDTWNKKYKVIDVISIME